MGMESSAMAINPQQPLAQSESLEHNITSIDNHWQDLELVPFSSQTFRVRPPASFGNEGRQPAGVDEYDFEQHAVKYFDEVSDNGSQQWLSPRSNQAVEPKTPSSISSSGTPKLGMLKMQPRVRHSQRRPSPKSTNPETHSLSSVTDKELTPLNQLTPCNQLTKTQNRYSGNAGSKKATTNRRVKQMVEPVPPPEPSTESSESMRSKMRESLAAALKLVIDEGNRDTVTEENEDLNVAKGTLDKPQEEENSGDIDMAAETDLQESRGAPGSSAFSSTNDSNKCNTIIEAGNRDASIEGDATADKMSMKKDDDIQLSNGLSVSSHVDSEGCEDNENHVYKKLKLTHGALNEVANGTPQRLASEIEGELFRLFGGVNKKYKEKGRSLLFNLKDRHNPELRKRVFSGEISPMRLCSMTAEELASKELTQWRIAKAEEFAQMVVLPDSETEFKSFVKKTHKGEVEVEVERGDSASVEVVLAGNTFSQSVHKDKEAGDHKLSKSSDRDASFHLKSKKDVSHSEKSGSDSMFVDNLGSGQHENTDLMQDLMVDEFRDSNSLPDIPTLDEFMKDLDEEPPFQNMLGSAVQGLPSEKGTRDGSKVSGGTAACYSEAIAASSHEIPRNTGKPQEKSAIKLDVANMSNVKAEGTESSPVDSKRPTTWEITGTTGSTDAKSSEIDARIFSGNSMNKALLGRSLSGRLASTAVNSEPVWDGLIQLNISSLVTAIGFYRSGAKASMKEWPTFLEIKGRVRLDSFEKFLQDLRLCRSRAIMILQICWKEGSPESGRVKLCETIDSYIADERVGFAEPVPGLELYFCPPHPNTTKILKTNLSKEHTLAIASAHCGFICVAVWRKSPTVSPEPPPPLKKQRSDSASAAHNLNVRSHHSAALPLPSPPPPPASEEPEDDDVPPGFGPSVMSVRDEDDLPEFNFDRSTTSKMLNHQLHQPAVQPPAAGPVEHFRELINKYGQNQNRTQSMNAIPAAAVGSNDDEDDDIPEWQPNPQEAHLRQSLPAHLYGLPPPPAPPLHYNQPPSQTVMPPNPPNEHFLAPPPGYHVPQQQFAAVGQWPHAGGQPWRGTSGPAQPEYCGQPPPPPPQWWPGGAAAGSGQPQRRMGRVRGGHFRRR